MNANILELIIHFSKEDNPLDAISVYIDGTEHTSKHFSELQDWYNVIASIQRKGHRIGYKKGRKDLLEEINDRFKGD